MSASGAEGDSATPTRRKHHGSPVSTAKVLAPPPTVTAIRNTTAGGSPVYGSNARAVSPYSSGQFTALMRTPPTSQPRTGSPTGSSTNGGGTSTPPRAAGSPRPTAAGNPASSSPRPQQLTGVSPYLLHQREALLTGSSPRRRDLSPSTAAAPRGTSSPIRTQQQRTRANSPLGGGSSPLRRPVSGVPRSPAGTGSPTAKARGGSPGSARLSSSWSMETREGRLVTLLTEFDQRSLRPWTGRVEEIEGRFVRLNYVSEEELRFLRHVRRRNEAFLHNMRSILKEAVAEGKGVDGQVAKQARGLADDANELNERILVVLRHANKAAASHPVGGSARRAAASRSGSADSRGSRAGSVDSRQTGVSVTPSMNDTSSHASFRGSPAARAGSPSKSRVVGVVPVPSLQEMPRPTARRVPNTPPATSVVKREDRRRMLEGVVALEKRSSLSPSDLEWAQSVFDRLYGPEIGPTRFHVWCNELANTPLVVRPSYYASARDSGVSTPKRRALVDTVIAKTPAPSSVKDLRSELASVVSDSSAA